MKTGTISVHSTAAAWGHAVLPVSCPRSLSEIAQICLLDHLVITTTREASKSYASIRELHQELFVVELVNKNGT